MKKSLTHTLGGSIYGQQRIPVFGHPFSWHAIRRLSGNAEAVMTKCQCREGPLRTILGANDRNCT